MDKIKVMLDDGAFLPERAHAEDAGMDIRTPVDIVVPPTINLGSVQNGSAVINTGVHVLIPKGYVGMLKSKSGLNVKNNLTGEGTIDAGYTGSIVVKLYNHGKEEVHLKRGDKITQLVILPIETPEPELVTEFPETDRGTNGFGSTGR